MDMYGIGLAIECSANACFMTSRGTGKTKRLIDQLKTGDCVYFATRKEAERVKNICRQKGIEIKTCIVNPADPGKLYNRPLSTTGQHYFDHAFVELFYLSRIREAGQLLEHFRQNANRLGYPENLQPTNPPKWK